MKTILVCLSIALYASFVVASDPEIVVGTNSFRFVFEDQMLAPSIRETILDDLVQAIVRWTNSPVIFYDNLSGKIDFQPNYCGQFEGERKYPSDFSRSSTNDVFRLLVNRSISNDYAQQLAFLSSRTGMVSAVASFVDFLNSDASASLSLENVPLFFYLSDSFLEYWDNRKHQELTLRDQWISQMPQYRYFMPSILDYWVWESDGDLPAGSLSVSIPVQFKDFQSSDPRMSPNTAIPASWVDGRWKIHPVVW